MIRRIVGSLLLSAIFLTASGQEKQVSEGNKLYEQQKYKEAASVYQRALTKNPNYLPGIFNLGNALYQQKNYDGSRKAFDNIAKQSKDVKVKSSSDYNVGNTYMAQQKWEDAVNAYKQSLRKNPQDEDAKYNLSYAKAMMKKNQGGGGKNNDKNKDQNKDKQDQQNKDNQNKDKQDQDKDKQQQDQDDKQEEKDKEQEDQKPQSQPSKLSEKQAEQLLNALAQEEKKLHDKKEKGKGVKVKVEKDW